MNIGHIATRTLPNKTLTIASENFHGAIDSSQDGTWSSIHIPQICTKMIENVQNFEYKHIDVGKNNHDK